MSVIPNNFLRCMSKEDRMKLGKVGMLPEEAEAKQVARTERDLQKQIVAYLRQRNIEVIWHRTDKRSTANEGCPDILFAVHNNSWVMPCAWEIKFGKGVPTREQTDMMHRMETGPNAWRVRIIRTFEEAVDELRELNV